MTIRTIDSSLPSEGIEQSSHTQQRSNQQTSNTIESIQTQRGCFGFIAGFFSYCMEKITRFLNMIFPRSQIQDTQTRNQEINALCQEQLHFDQPLSSQNQIAESNNPNLQEIEPLIIQEENVDNRPFYQQLITFKTAVMRSISGYEIDEHVISLSISLKKLILFLMIGENEEITNLRTADRFLRSADIASLKIILNRAIKKAISKLPYAIFLQNQQVILIETATPEQKMRAFTNIAEINVHPQFIVRNFAPAQIIDIARQEELNTERVDFSSPEFNEEKFATELQAIYSRLNENEQIKQQYLTHFDYLMKTLLNQQEIQVEENQVGNYLDFEHQNTIKRALHLVMDRGYRRP